MNIQTGKNDILFCGIDQAINCTSITYIFNNEVSSALIMRKPPQYLSSTKDIKLYAIKEKYDSNEERFYDTITQIMTNLIENIKLNYKPNEFMLMIEDYSYGSVGMTFEIGEFVGLLKHYLHCHNIKFEVISPPTLKKYVKHGRMDKTEIFEAFCNKADENIDPLYNSYYNMLKEFFKNSKIAELKKLKEVKSPLSDLLDSYYIAHYLRENYKG